MNGATRRGASIDSGSPLRAENGIHSLRISEASKLLLAADSESRDVLCHGIEQLRIDEPHPNAHAIWSKLEDIALGRKGPFG